MKFFFRNFSPSTNKGVSQHAVGSLNYLLGEYGDLLLDNCQFKLHVCLQDNPKFYKPRTVPYALRSAIDDELNCLKYEWILDKVTHSEWATTIVAVPKPDGRVRLCGDFKVTVNQFLNIDQYPPSQSWWPFWYLGGREEIHEVRPYTSYPWTRSRRSTALSTWIVDSNHSLDSRLGSPQVQLNFIRLWTPFCRVLQGVCAILMIFSQTRSISEIWRKFYVYCKQTVFEWSGSVFSCKVSLSTLAIWLMQMENSQLQRR